MNNDTIGTATVKITADISDLKEKIEQAKNVSKGLDNFKIRAGEDFSGNWEEYQQYIAKTNAEYEQYIANQESATSATQQLTSAVQELKPAVSETTESADDHVKDVIRRIDECQASIGTLKDRFLTIKDKVTHPFETIGASLKKTEQAISETSRIGRTALIGLATALTALGKSSVSEYAKYNKEAAKTQEDFAEASTRLKLTIGQLLQPVAQVLTGIMEWISRNREIVTGVLTFVGILAGSAGLIALVQKLSGAFAVLKGTAGGVIGIISVLAGLATGIAVSNMEFENYTETLEETKKREDELTRATETYNNAISDMNKQIADAQKGIAEATRNYRQSLKKILVDHEKTVDNLTQQIKDANAEYNRAIEERNADFALSMQEEEEEHQKKVDELTTQIDFLQRYNNKYNKEKLEQLKFALAKENNRHKEQTKLMEEQLRIQNENEKKKLDERVAGFQEELDEEVTFLKKHRATLESVRNEIIDDEVESLTRQYQATLAGYNESIALARQKGAEAGVAWAKAFGDATRSGAVADYIYNGVKKTLKDVTYKLGQGTTPNGQAMTGQVISAESLGRLLYLNEGYASGGYTGQGTENEVAGVVHKGEYVLPQDMVDQTTGTPKAMGNTFNINVSGVFATSAMERRKVANDIMNAINQTNYARLGA